MLYRFYTVQLYVGFFIVVEQEKLSRLPICSRILNEKASVSLYWDLDCMLSRLAVKHCPFKFYKPVQ